MALIAVAEQQGKEIELGVSRFTINPDGESCEFALVVADNMSGKGLGSKLMTALLEAARSKGLRTMEGEVLKNNSSMLHLMSRLGFSAEVSREDDDIKVVRLTL